MVVAEPPPQPGQQRVSHEAELLKALQTAIADLGVVSVRGQGIANKFAVSGWELSPLQQFQYGDLGIERAVRASLRQDAPEVAFLGEEESPDGSTKGLTWALDPIDGTANLVHNLPLSGALVAARVAASALAVRALGGSCAILDG